MTIDLPRDAGRSAALLFLPALLGLGCAPAADDPLPNRDNLYRYALAVAEKAGLKVPSQRARALFNRGRVHERFGFEEQALEDYRRAIEADDRLGVAYERIGFVLSQRGNRMTEAIEAYRAALRSNPESAGVHTRLALIFLHQGRLDDAIKAAGEEVRRRTASAATFYYLGQAYSKQRRRTEAIDAFREALRRDPRMRSAHYAMAMELRFSGDTAGSEASLKRFRELEPPEDPRVATGERDNRTRERRLAAETWLDAGDLYLRAAGTPAKGGSPDARAGTFMTECLAALEETVRLDPSYFEAWDTYIVLLRRQGKLEAALQLADRARKAMPEDGNWPYRGALLRLQLAQATNEPEERLHEAVALLEEATRKAPDFAPAHFQLAYTVLRELKSTKGELIRRAIEHAKAAVDLDPAPAHYDVLAFGYHLTHRVDLARSCLEEGIRKNPGASRLKHRLEMLERSLEGPR